MPINRWLKPPIWLSDIHRDQRESAMQSSRSNFAFQRADMEYLVAWLQAYGISLNSIWPYFKSHRDSVFQLQKTQTKGINWRRTLINWKNWQCTQRSIVWCVSIFHSRDNIKSFQAPSCFALKDGKALNSYHNRDTGLSAHSDTDYSCEFVRAIMYVLLSCIVNPWIA